MSFITTKLHVIESRTPEGIIVSAAVDGDSLRFLAHLLSNARVRYKVRDACGNQLNQEDVGLGDMTGWLSRGEQFYR